MPWFRNHYVCIACEGHWLAEAAAAQDGDCPFCRAYDVTPYKSDDWTLIVEPQGKASSCWNAPRSARTGRTIAGAAASRAAMRRWRLWRGAPRASRICTTL